MCGDECQQGLEPARGKVWSPQEGKVRSPQEGKVRSPQEGKVWSPQEDKVWSPQKRKVWGTQKRKNWGPWKRTAQQTPRCNTSGRRVCRFGRSPWRLAWQVPLHHWFAKLAREMFV